MGRRLKLQNRIGQSIATLPICALLILILWWFPQGRYSQDYVVALVLTTLIAYIITETNNTYMLLRTRSRMIASVWLFASACIGLLHPFQPATLGTFCLAVSYYLLFRTYQHPEPVTDVFHTFVLLSLGGLFFSPIFFFAPFFLWYLIVFMRALTLRTLFASLLGLALPFWFWGGWQLLQGDFSPFLNWWGTLPSHIHIYFPLPDNGEVTAMSLLSLGLKNGGELLWMLLLTFLSIWTGIAYLSYSYDDKIRTRMMFYVYIFQMVLTLLYTVLLSGDFTYSNFLPVLLLNASPLVAHYFTLRNTWTSFVMFFIVLLGCTALALLTLSPLHIAL